MPRKKSTKRADGSYEYKATIGKDLHGKANTQIILFQQESGTRKSQGARIHHRLSGIGSDRSIRIRCRTA